MSVESASKKAFWQFDISDSILNELYVGEKSVEIARQLTTSNPSDRIVMTKSSFEKGLDFLKKCGIDINHRIPSDIFFSGEIPLMDCELEIKWDKPHFEFDGTYRFAVFQDYKDRIANSVDGYAIVGCLILPRTVGTLATIEVHKGDDYISIRPNSNSVSQNKIVRMTPETVTVAIVIAMVATWYFVQIALLHPTVKDVFSNPCTELVFDANAKPTKNGKRGRITRYIKRHVIRENDLEKALYGTSERHINRQALAWYVIGHWRHYKNGNTIFIKGYWKGALRDLKKNLDEGRERIIVLPNEKEQ